MSRTTTRRTVAPPPQRGLLANLPSADVGPQPDENQSPKIARRKRGIVQDATAQAIVKCGLPIGDARDLITEVQHVHERFPGVPFDAVFAIFVKHLARFKTGEPAIAALTAELDRRAAYLRTL